MFGALADIATGVANWRTSYQLSLQDIMLRYRRSVLGPFWISASLVTTVLALAYVFSAVFQQALPDYIAYLAAGMMTWQLILALVQEGCGSVVEHASLLRNVALPLSVVAGRVVFRNAIILAHNLVAIIGVASAFGRPPTLIALEALGGIATILLLGYFCALFAGPLCARFRDIPQAVQSVMQVIFFMTPIFWMPSAASHRPIFTHGNPFYHLIELVRAPLLGQHASAMNWQVSLSACAVMAVLALITVAATRKQINLWL